MTAPMASPESWEEERRQEKTEAHSSFTRSSRGFNAVLLALAGAVLAGIGQLAGSGAIIDRPAPVAVGAALIGAMLSVVVGVVFVAATFVMGYCSYRLKYGRPVNGKRHVVRDQQRRRLELWKDRMEMSLPTLLTIQMLAWLGAAVAYSFTLHWVSRYLPPG